MTATMFYSRIYFSDINKKTIFHVKGTLQEEGCLSFCLVPDCEVNPKEVKISENPY